MIILIVGIVFWWSRLGGYTAGSIKAQAAAHEVFHATAVLFAEFQMELDDNCCTGNHVCCCIVRGALFFFLGCCGRYFRCSTAPVRVLYGLYRSSTVYDFMLQKLYQGSFLDAVFIVIEIVAGR